MQKLPGQASDKSAKNDSTSGVDVIDAMCNANGGNGEEESWSDEEGEDPNYTYNYSLRRRRYNTLSCCINFSRRAAFIKRMQS